MAASRSTRAEARAPELVSALAEGYRRADFAADIFAGLSVAVIALPLSLALAVASGLPPQHGLAAAAVGGFIVSLLGGSRWQIGGPAGAFIGLVAASVAAHGVEGMLAATALAGVMLALAGLLGLGVYIRLVPYPVTVGFTAGIAVIIAASQLAPALGLAEAGAGGHGGAAGAIADAARAVRAGETNGAALLVAILTFAMVAVIRRRAPRLPAILIAVVAASALSSFAGLDIETIGSRFGASALAAPALRAPPLDPALLARVLPDALAFALLGAIESLLSASVADGMTGRRARPNVELLAQGAANVAAAFAGAMPVTGAIARTAANVRAGGRTPVAGMAHAVFLAGLALLAAPLVGHVPLAALAGVLIHVAWTMVERAAIAGLLRHGGGDALALAATFALTVFRSLTEAIVAGSAIGAVAFIARMARAAQIEEAPHEDGAPAPEGVAVYRISGPLFFGSASSLAKALDSIVAGRRALVIDLSDARFVDASGAEAMRVFALRARRRGVRVAIAGASPEAARALAAARLGEEGAAIHPTREAAFAALAAQAAAEPAR